MRLLDSNMKLVCLCGLQVNAQDSPELRLLRPKVLTAAGFLGHAGVMAQAIQKHSNQFNVQPLRLLLPAAVLLKPFA